MPTAAQRKAAAKKAAATRRANRDAASTVTVPGLGAAAPAAAAKGKHVPVLPDGVGPHDDVKFRHLIQLGIIRQVSEMGGEAEAPANAAG